MAKLENLIQEPLKERLKEAVAEPKKPKRPGVKRTPTKNTKKNQRVEQNETPKESRKALWNYSLNLDR